jgi:hypothetical protein
MTFWNKVQQGVGRAAAEAEKQARLTRLNLQVGEAEGSLRKKKQDLGDVALKLCRDGKLAHPDLESLLPSIAEDEKRIAELQEQVAQLQAPTTQPADDSPSPSD